MVTVSPPAPGAAVSWTYGLQLPRDPRAPRIARTTLRAVLRAHGMCELADTAELLASELVTNAYRHTLGPSALRLSALEGLRGLRVSVWDADPHVPAGFGRLAGSHPVRASDEADRGRGLLLVRQCADDWGGRPLGGDRWGRWGKLLWFELRER